MSKILAQIKTKEQLDKFFSDLDQLEQFAFKTDSSFDDYIQNNLDAGLAEIVLVDLAKNPNKKMVIDEYEKQLKDAVIVKLVVSQNLSSAFLETLSSYIKSTLGESAILDIRVNKGILGGAIVEYGGRVSDGSLNSIFYTKRNKIQKIINNLTQDATV